MVLTPDLWGKLMATHKTSDENSQSYTDQMGYELGSIFDALWREVEWLHIKWNEYVELYGTKPSRIDLLNKSAPLFFKVIQDSLFEDTLLHIARLTDREKTSGRDNLTILRLPGLITDTKAKDNVEQLIGIAIENAEFARDWRNRRLAHSDLDLVTKSGVKPVAPASRDKVKNVLESIAAVLNAVHMHYTKSPINFAQSSITEGVASLLYVLDDGIQAEDERQKRLEAGDYRQDDYKARDL